MKTQQNLLSPQRLGWTFVLVGSPDRSGLFWSVVETLMDVLLRSGCFRSGCFRSGCSVCRHTFGSVEVLDSELGEGSFQQFLFEETSLFLLSPVNDFTSGLRLTSVQTSLAKCLLAEPRTDPTA